MHFPCCFFLGGGGGGGGWVCVCLRFVMHYFVSFLVLQSEKERAGSFAFIVLRRPCNC